MGPFAPPSVLHKNRKRLLAEDQARGGLAEKNSSDMKECVRLWRVAGAKDASTESRWIGRHWWSASNLLVSCTRHLLSSASGI